MAREANNLPSPEQEYDFIQDPPRDFFCAVTFDLLLEPHQTGCCGHHLSRGVVERLKRERKPCPMCQHEKFETHPDLYLRRKVLELHVRCPYKAGGCECPGAKVRVITREARYYAKTRAFASFYAIISRAHAARAVT